MKLTFRPEALADLEEIYDYIAEDNSIAAATFLAELRERCGVLAEQPLIGRERPELHPDLRGFTLISVVFPWVAISSSTACLPMRSRS